MPHPLTSSTTQISLLELVVAHFEKNYHINRTKSNGGKVVQRLKFSIATNRVFDFFCHILQVFDFFVCISFLKLWLKNSLATMRAASTVLQFQTH